MTPPNPDHLVYVIASYAVAGLMFAGLLIHTLWARARRPKDKDKTDDPAS